MAVVLRTCYFPTPSLRGHFPLCGLDQHNSARILSGQRILPALLYHISGVCRPRTHRGRHAATGSNALIDLNEIPLQPFKHLPPPHTPSFDLSTGFHLFGDVS